MKKTNLLIKARIYLFIGMLGGLLTAIGGFVNYNRNMSAVGLVLLSLAVALAIIFESIDEQNEKNNKNIL